MRTWNKRAVQGALIRLDQSGMIKRFRVRKKKTEDSWVICIQIQREPRAEDLENLGFRRQAVVADPTDELLQDDGDGDTLMRDLEIDMLDDDDGNEANGNLDENIRIPPQWTPDRLLANILFNYTELGQVLGWDSVVLRNRVVGPFWRRPMESYLTRLTDDWERMQPAHLRHLAIIRDTRNTEEKKFIHYVYRTHGYFQQAVFAGEAIWEGVRKPPANTEGKSNQLKKNSNSDPLLDLWGFRGLNQKDFVRSNGTATLADVRSAIVNPRKYGPRWDNALAEEIGYQKSEIPVKAKVSRRSKDTEDLDDTEDVDNLSLPARATGKRKIGNVTHKRSSTLTITVEERIALGLKTTGRLSKSVMEQILSHRQETGDPDSLPTTVVEEANVIRAKAPLMTKEERLAENLPARGRLGLEKENEIRERRGLPKLVEKARKKRASNQTAILSKQQRITLGFKGDGRLHQHFIDALRKEQENDVPLEQSPAVQAYRDFLKVEAAKGARAATRKDRTGTVGLHTTVDEHVPPQSSEVDQHATSLEAVLGSPPPRLSTSGTAKRKTSGYSQSPLTSKKTRTTPDSLQNHTTVTPRRTSELARERIAVTEPINIDSGDISNESIEITETSLHRSPQKNIQASSTVPVIQNQVGSFKPLSSELENNISNQEIARTSPGVYVYLHAKRKVARGRPRNACIVVFQTSRLFNLPWFEEEAGSEISSQLVNLGDVTSHVKITTKDREPPNSPGTNGGALSPQDSQRSPQSEAVYELGKSADSGMPSSLQQRESGSDVQHECITATSQQPLASAAEAGVATQGIETRAISTMNTINASGPVIQSSYQSPYAPSARSDITVSVNQAVAVDATYNPTIRLESPNFGMSSTVPTPEGVVGTIAEVEHANTATLKKLNARGAGPGITGSALKFRRQIILEIIERCGGVFPLHGEIWRPFKAIWDQRHGHTSMSIPGSSTVSDTLKNMINSPAFNLKRMAFLVKARNATGAKERVMVTRSDMSPNDKRVVQLAYNMANNALDKSHQFYPEEIRGVFEHETLYFPLPAAPKDETLFLDQIYPELLESSIKENKDRRRREKAAQKQREKQAAKMQNEQVEKYISKRRVRAQVQQVQGAPRVKRTRLASLNDKDKRYRRAPAQVPSLEIPEETTNDHGARESSPARSDSSEEVPLMTLRPWVASEIVDCGADDGDAAVSDAEDEEEELDGDVPKSLNTPLLDLSTVSFTDPVVRFESRTGTFSTLFSLITPPAETPSRELIASSRKSANPSKTRKRVRINDSLTERPSKKSCHGAVPRPEILDDEFVYGSVDDSDATSSEDEEEDVRPKRKQKSKVFPKRVSGKNATVPTLLERLTGLTGNPNDPVYTDPVQRRRPDNMRPWIERKKKQTIKVRKEREYAETLDQSEKFKKLCFTLVLASSVSEEDGVVDWTIVQKVYARDKFFSVLKTKKLWTWMQAHMTAQLDQLSNNLQTNLLAAYDAGRLPTIDDPNIYDWAGLLRWTMRTCEYSELSLPVHREALERFNVDESNYTALDRVNWYGKRMADSMRTQLQLQLSFVAPLHRSRAQVLPVENNELRARSWIRANTATPQVIYHANKAHEKLKLLGEDILVSVVGNFVQQEHLKMRKLKRQLPGRNYTFTKKFAKMYKRPFELEDFMVAVTVKKELDAVFANDDPEKRFYDISRSEEDGSVMAIMSLVSDGTVKLIPKLPPVENGFGAPLPRLSKWGFCEGDYIHRAIDRNRLFWDIHVVPTSKYQFGSPLQPLPFPAADWPSLPEPFLPGKTDDNALLPIWSSIDGQSTTWPWWYRILNLVLQPLFLQPGATAVDIHAHCPEHTTEVFEVQLVLDWLTSIGAVSETLGGGYQVRPNFWAAFGDRLLHTENDWFGEHVKRKNKMTTKRQWRDKYNLRYHTMHARDMHSVSTNNLGTSQANDQTRDDRNEMSQRIARNSKAQYGILQKAILEPQSSRQPESTIETQVSPAAELQMEEMQDVQNEFTQTSADTALIPLHGDSTTHTPGETSTPNAEMEMEDAGVDVGAESEDLDAEGEDVDAEGEFDDAMY
jgi:hypothetical protein